MLYNYTGQNMLSAAYIKHETTVFCGNTIHEILAHRLRRQPNIEPTVGQRLVFASMCTLYIL